MQYFFKLSFLLLALILSACGEKPLQPIPPESIILAFGDSLTFGIGTSQQYSYPSVLAKISGYKVVNAGISGEKTAGGLARLNEVLEQHQPSLLILLEGGNDILKDVDLRKTKHNLSKMIELAQAKDIQVFLIGVPKKGLFLRTVNIYQQLADEYSLLFDRDLVTDLLKKNQHKSDLIHFNQSGYRLMAEKIHQVLLDKGVVE
jgi:lysophospholipase L1-like esterase